MKELLPYQLDENFFNSFGKEWALVIVEDNNEDNAMTISWGQIGILWSRPVVSVYVRNTRYTKHMLDNAASFSVCFFNEEFKDKLAYCGRVSRRDEDKISKCKFTRLKDESTLYVKEARLTFILKKIYQVDMPIDPLHPYRRWGNRPCLRSGRRSLPSRLADSFREPPIF